MPTNTPVPYTKLLLQKNGSVTPTRQQAGAFNPPSPMDYFNNMPFLRYSPTDGLTTETQGQSAQRGDILGQVTTLFNENKVDLIVGIVGVLLVILALSQIVKPI